MWLKKQAAVGIFFGRPGRWQPFLLQSFGTVALRLRLPVCLHGLECVARVGWDRVETERRRIQTCRLKNGNMEIGLGKQSTMRGTTERANYITRAARNFWFCISQ